MKKEIIDIADRRELFVDHLLIEQLDGAVLKLHSQFLDSHSKDQEVTFSGHPAKNEKSFAYSTIILEDSRYRLFYRGYTGKDGSDKETFCCAESHNGVQFHKPDLGIHEVEGSKHNNVLITGVKGIAHNFSPMLDHRPGVSAEQKYKALAGTGPGLGAFASADGIHWEALSDDLVINAPSWSPHNFDSQNISFWSESEQCYVAYYRTWKVGVEGVILDFPQYGMRWMSRSVSDDFINWSEPVEIIPDNGCYEHIYTTQTAPYFRAPHIYIAPATRFVPTGRDTFKNTVDIALMTSRPGTVVFNRTFMESFIRPGLDQQRWTNRSNYITLNIVPVNDEQMVMYVFGIHNILRRLVLRMDGLASVNAGYGGGELTRPFAFKGDRLEINAATSSVGSVAVELQTAAGQPIKGYSLADCAHLNGDKISWTVGWKRDGENTESDVSRFAGKPVRLHFVIKDADLYSFKFNQQNDNN